MERLYPCNKEYEKIIRHNGQWYKLKSIFDEDSQPEEFDFNKELQTEEPYDFNSSLQDNTEIPDTEIKEYPEDEFDFNDAIADDEVFDFNEIIN